MNWTKLRIPPLALQFLRGKNLLTINFFFLPPGLHTSQLNREAGETTCSQVYSNPLFAKSHAHAAIIPILVVVEPIQSLAEILSKPLLKVATHTHTKLFLGWVLINTGHCISKTIRNRNANKLFRSLLAPASAETGPDT